MEQPESLFGYWGKTRTSYHLLPYHCLDVAAVGQVYLERHPSLRRFLAEALGIDERSCLALATFFLSLHDLGKFAESFQNQRRDLLWQLQHRQSERCYGTRHDSLGHVVWNRVVLPALVGEDWLGLGAAVRPWSRVFDVWAQAVTGHHGQPPQQDPYPNQTLGDSFTDADRQAVLAFAKAMRDLFLLPDRVRLPAVDAKALKTACQRLSWWLAGIAVLADWLGSNTRYFDYCDRPMPLERYWRRARRQARTALAESGVMPAPPAREVSFNRLFLHLAGAEPTPLQRLALELPLGEGPQLFVLEDVTGAGKTEAALLLVQRLMAADRAAGVYVGLPTMATANAMYDRLGEVYRRLFDEHTRPSLILAHGARDLSYRFRQSILAPGAAEEDYASDDVSAGHRCAAWLADHRKKALLAQVGVGTVDQALLSILYSRHQSLRLLGLFGKVLVADEVHANDAYMHQLLKTLLRFHAAAAGSAILLSATLPRRMREELATEFRTGLDRGPIKLGSMAYPLLTRVDGGEECVEKSLATRPEVARRVEVSRLDDPQAVVREIVAAVGEGRCVCWVCNTVFDAREAYRAVRQAFREQSFPEENVDLFHARYVMAQRLAIENRVIERFGKTGTAEQRRGRVLIATQVVEQSLDLDFDRMISDLAPVDLLIQRAGRLCRHVRDAAGNPLKQGADQRGVPRLFVHGPAPVNDAGKDWYSDPFPKAANVYKNHAQLWLTARLLEEKGGFAMPEDARRLIEGVYGDAVQPVPAELEASDIRDYGERSASSAQAQQNSLVLDQGYNRQGFDWWQEALTPTRLQERPDTTLRLARWKDGELKPWEDSGRYAWEQSQVKIARYYAREAAPVADAALKAALENVVAELPDKGRWSVLVPMGQEREGLWRGEVQNDKGEVGTLYYDEGLGLLRADEL